ncbi:uncharacterized protein [Nicotiana tomentosiformis]|uniref:uncharacterized protein n=1 Tax=Nicotiana tomentosiformis TaxID=4098 RepID=UPI00388C753B
MDFVVGLPWTLMKLDVVWVIVDKLTKLAQIYIQDLADEGYHEVQEEGQADPKVYWPFEVLRHVEEVVYELALPPSLLGVHPVFHVSMLWKYHDDRSHVLDYSTVQLDESLGYEEEPVAIVDRQVRQLRSKKISAVKVEWRVQPVEEATWETEEDMQSIYPYLFSTLGLILDPFEDEHLFKRWII